MELRKISKEELKEILELHKKWLNYEEGGERADLSYTDLRYVDLRYANLIDADLRYVDLSYANLSYANLSYANLSEANLIGADLTNINYNEKTSFFALQCPEEGSFIGYKKANGYIVKLLILEDSKRSSATTRKCRCDKAKVLSITNLDGSDSGLTEVCSDYDNDFIYRIGEIVEVEDFNENRWNECSTGIHFFITRQEAINY